MTRQRQLIYDIIMSEPKHRTAEEIFLLAREKMPSLALGTVYRNLGILAEEGKILRLEMPDATARYDRQTRPHPHLVCRRCGQVEDLAMPDGLLDPLIQPLGVKITGFDLNLFYDCPSCASGNRRRETPEA